MKILLSIAFVAFVFSGAHAQLRQTVTIDEVQVPVSVREALNRDFSDLHGKGTWSVNILRNQEGGVASTVPQWYTFSSKEGKSRIEVRYSPEGELLATKGISASNRVN